MAVSSSLMNGAFGSSFYCMLIEWVLFLYTANYNTSPPTVNFCLKMKPLKTSGLFHPPISLGRSVYINMVRVCCFGFELLSCFVSAILARTAVKGGKKQMVVVSPLWYIIAIVAYVTVENLLSFLETSVMEICDLCEVDICFCLWKTYLK